MLSTFLHNRKLRFYGVNFGITVFHLRLMEASSSTRMAGGDMHWLLVYVHMFVLVDSELSEIISGLALHATFVVLYFNVFVCS